MGHNFLMIHHRLLSTLDHKVIETQFTVANNRMCNRRWCNVKIFHLFYIEIFLLT